MERVRVNSFIDSRAVHEVVRFLAARCDGANALDGQGFNKQDSFNGRSWANAQRLTDEQAKNARDMVRKYRRQIPDELWRKMWR
jgi:hypothetical protein